PVVNSDDLTVAVRPCIYQYLLESERPVVCSVHAKLVRQQLEQVDGPLMLRRLHPFTSAHSCLLVLGAGEQEPLVSEENVAVPGIPADRSDTKLGESALEAQRHAEEGASGDGPSCPL